MAEHPKTRMDTYPFIGVEEMMLRLGISEQTAYIGTPESTREYIGLELDRATSWLKIRTGWEFTEAEEISDDNKSYIADTISFRVAHFYYQRLAGIRLDRSDDFRILSRENYDRAEENLTYIQKSKWYSENITPKDTGIKEE